MIVRSPTPLGLTAIRAALGALATVASIGVLSACGSTKTTGEASAVASQTANEALESSRQAARRADSVTIRGSSSLGGFVKSRFDLKLARTGGQGTVNLIGKELELIRSGHALYVKGDADTYRSLDVNRSVPPNTWVEFPVTKSQLQGLVDKADETARVIASGGSATKGPTTTIDGEPVLELKTEGKLYKGRLFVKAEGEPYPVKLEKHGRENATFTFTAWNATSVAPAPTKSVTARR